jgi:hypothetical protein
MDEPPSQRYHKELMPVPIAGDATTENVRMPRYAAMILRAQAAPMLIIAASLLAVGGCGDGRLATYPVSGTVMIDGQPAHGALVIFCPVEGQGVDELMRLRPAAETGPDGKYRLTTFETYDGAPAGQYQVMVRWGGPRPTTTEGGRPERSRRPPDRLRGRYMNPQTSGLMVTVEDEATEVPPFELRTN